MSETIDFGIDLGTTNSSVALCRRGEVRVFQTTDLMNVTPSVVYVSKSGRMLVGKKAYDTWVQDPQNTQAEFKRWMGYSDKLIFPASGKHLSAEELSAEILKGLRADAERATQERVTSAVITVPAAFGSLQCDATGRAAKMAGFDQAPLLQEPIAAAVAYGASPSAANQRWMVFDLGGGTLDIAIISTRNGRLAVLEHQGNNRLGGKDIDRAIADEFLFAPLSKSFSLPDAKSDAAGHHRLTRFLIRHAEQAKIALSTAEQVTIELFDIGDDNDGNPIEATLTLKRSEMESKIGPIVEQCLDLANRALEGARVAGSELDRVLLVGGPTQMPILRAALQQALGAKLDHSLDPMTVVSHGAALFASTIERTGAPAVSLSGSAPAQPVARGAVAIQLAHERASGTAQSPVAGVIAAGSSVHEVKIDAAGGFWTSGWLPIANGAFAVDVMLNDNRAVTLYSVTARDKTGNAVPVTPEQFSITYMLPMSAAPLPHTIAIELSTHQGVTSFDPVFKRGCPLPAEVRKTYKADRTLRPSELETTLPIKFWEIDVSEDLQEKWWAGCITIGADRIKRPIVEGSDLELTIKIDASRKMTVELFIPLLNQSLADDVYIPDPPSSRSQLQQQLDLCFEKLDRIHEEMYATDRDDDLGPRVRQLHQRADAIAEQLAEDEKRSGQGIGADPDASLRSTDSIRKLRMQLVQLEEQLNLGTFTSSTVRELRWAMPHVERLIATHGTEPEQQEVQKLRTQYERFLEADDARGLKWLCGQLWTLHWGVVQDKMWYWQSRLASLKLPGRRFLNRDQATKLIEEAEAANARSDMSALRSACKRALELLPPDQLQAAREQESQSGLRQT